MPYAFSISDLRLNGACSLDFRIIDLENHLNRDVPEEENIPMPVWAEITLHVVDLIWALRVRPEGAVIAAEVARRAAARVPDNVYVVSMAKSASAHAAIGLCECAVYYSERVVRLAVQAAGEAAFTRALDDRRMDVVAADAADAAARAAFRACVRTDVLELTTA